MKKLLCVILTLIVCIGCVSASAQQLEIPDVQWEFPVPLTDVLSEYAMLVNEDNLLDKSFKPDPLVKVKNVKRATNADVYLEQTAAEALKMMFEAAAQVTEYTYTTENGKTKTATYGDNGMVLYLKSGYRSYGRGDR